VIDRCEDEGIWALQYVTEAVPAHHSLLEIESEGIVEIKQVMDFLVSDVNLVEW
jgi:hypothetical protein